MTKAEFRASVMDAMQTILEMPDDLWDSGYAMLRVRREGSDEVVVVGIEEVSDGEDRDD